MKSRLNEPLNEFTTHSLEEAQKTIAFTGAMAFRKLSYGVNQPEAVWKRKYRSTEIYRVFENIWMLS